jgi:tRNA(fMet)-specific endonuclease VapC
MGKGSQYQSRRRIVDVYLLDTNIISTALDQRRNTPLLEHRILSQSPDSIFISIITVEEMLRGELGGIHRLRHKPHVVTVYRAFEGLFEALHRFQVVSYTSEIEQIYQSMSWEQKRVGTQDCRIAATAIALDYTVVTANKADFVKIGGVRLEDWRQ